MSIQTDRLVQPTGLVGMYTTVATESEASHLSNLIVQQRLAACVQVDGPIQSTYVWQGRLERTEEWRLLAKTTEAQAQLLAAFVLDNHPYDEPEVLFVPFVVGSTGYVRWVEAQVK